MKTYSTKSADLVPQWHVFDASGKILGRLASEVAILLLGKHKPIYTYHLNTGDYVIVVNAAKVRVTGKKAQQKMYYRHSNYPGGLKSTTFAIPGRYASPSGSGWEVRWSRWSKCRKYGEGGVVERKKLLICHRQKEERRSSG